MATELARGSRPRKSWRRKLMRAIPRRRHLREGRLHRLVGDRLFRHELWAFDSRRGIAGGLALGIFIGCTPTMGVQVVLCSVAAYLLRVNIPLAIIGTLISNPFTAPILYPLEYKLGLWLVGMPPASEFEGLSGALRSFMRYARPLWAGALVAGGVLGVVGYAVGVGIWLVTKAMRPGKRARVTW